MLGHRWKSTSSKRSRGNPNLSQLNPKHVITQTCRNLTRNCHNLTRTCHNLTLTCHNLTRTCHNLTRTCHNLTRTCYNLTRTCHNLTRTCHDLTRTCHNLTRTCSREASAAESVSTELLKLLRYAARRGLSEDDSFRHFDVKQVDHFPSD